MRVGIAADHGGFQMKEQLAKKLSAEGHDVFDFRNMVFDAYDDYPDSAIPLARAVANGFTAPTRTLLGGFDASVDCSRFAQDLPGVGMKFAARYYSDNPEKTLTPPEARKLSNAGLQLVVVFQDANDAVGAFSADRGRAAAQKALAGFDRPKPVAAPAEAAQTTTAVEMPAASLQGDLEVFGLPALLQSLAESSASGSLTLKGPKGGDVFATLTMREGKLIEMRRKLAENRLAKPLFDTVLSAGHIEAAYAAMYERYQAGLPPEGFRVSQFLESA